MYIGYNLSLSDDLFKDTKAFYDAGKVLYQDAKEEVVKELSGFIKKDGSLDGAEIEKIWFPQINTDVFISHSHQDKKLAIWLAGVLNITLDLKVFVDSSIWGYANDLLLMIDKKYCKLDDKHYSYKKRNYSTSHVHMMLNTALMKMIDKTECIIFLNTPSSISISEVTNNTKSPWIYSEISMTRMLRRKAPNRHIEELQKGGEVSARNLEVIYEVDLDHLIILNPETLLSWIVDRNEVNGSKHLDRLYNLTGGRPKSKVIYG